MKVLKELPAKIIYENDTYILAIDYNCGLWGIGYRLPALLNICLIYISSPDLDMTTKIMKSNIKSKLNENHKLVYQERI